MSKITFQLTDRNISFVENYTTEGFSSKEELINFAIRQIRTECKQKDMEIARQRSIQSIKSSPRDFVWESIDGEPFAEG